MNNDELFLTLDKLDQEFYLHDYPDTNYYGINTGNNILHIASYIGDNFLKYSDEFTIFINNNKGVINQKNNKKRPPISEAIIRLNFKFAMFLLDFDEIDVNIKSDDWNILKLAFNRNNLEISEKLINMGANYSVGDIRKITDNEVKSKVVDILLKKKPITDKISNVDEMKLFKREDFVEEEGSSAGSGTYGDTTITYIKDSGKKCIIKKFKKGSEYFLDNSAIKDIAFLNSLKRKSTTVDILGIYVDKDNIISMVLEYLKFNTREYFELLRVKGDSPERRKIYKELLYSLLITSKANSDVGIIHCDTKDDNIMIDEYGNVKFIDYGISSYLGISPYNDLVNHRIHIGSYLAYDGFKSNRTATFIDDDDNRIEYKSSVVGLNIDLSSIVTIFLWGIRDNGHSYYSNIFTHDNKIYNNSKVIKIKENNINDKIILTEDETYGVSLAMESLYDDEMIEIFKNMLEIDASKRKSSSDLLLDPYFKELHKSNNMSDKIDITDKIDMTLLPHKMIDNNEILSNYNSITDNIDMLLPNVDNIIDYWSIQKPDMLNKNNNITYDIALLFNENNINLDCFFNAVFYMYHYFNNDKNYLDLYSEINNDENLTTIEKYNKHEELRIKTNNFTRVNKINTKNNILLFTCIAQYESVFSSSKFEIVELYHIYREYNSTIDLKKFTVEVNKYLEKIKGTLRLYTIKPVMLYFGYIKLILQMTIIEPEIILRLINNCIENTIKVFIELDCSDYTIFDVVIACYYLVPGHIDIILKKNDELYDKIINYMIR